jgi:phosphate-selective porin OprO/OprP
MKTNHKLKHLTVAAVTAVVGAQFSLSALADGNGSQPAQTEVSGQAANTSGGDPVQAAEIKALKEEVDVLVKKVNALEQKQSVAVPSQQSAQVQELDQKVRILERERENDQDTAAAAAKTQPKISMGQNGFSFGSADGSFVGTLHSLLQFDSRTFFADHDKINGNDGFILRRARPIFTGTVFHDFDFNFTPDFGGSTVQIQDAYVNYRFNPALQVEAGKFKSPVGLEQLQPDAYALFNERSIATDLTPNRDLGVELHGDLFDGILSYAAGIFDGASDNNGTTFNSDTDDGKAFAGRLFAQPWKDTQINALKGLGIGVGGSYEYSSHGSVNGLNPSFTSDGQQKFFTYASTAVADGTHWRLSPQGYYYYGPFSLMAEYTVTDQRLAGGSVTHNAPEDFQNTAWEISGGWVLTGEDASYNGVTPLHSFNPKAGNWGAWQLVARYADLDVDDDIFKDGFANPLTSASEARAWSVGVNWYLNKNIRVNTSFSHTSFTGGHGAAATVTAYPENVLFTRIQLAF